MSRPLRIEFQDAVYHVTTRGNRGAPIFFDDTDRMALLQTFAQGLQRYDASAFAYCLMGNHYHIVLQTHRPNLSRLMRYINGVHSQKHNHRHGLTGHLFQGRFHAILVQKDSYLLATCRYVDLNPVRAGLTPHPGHWPWSSFCALVGVRPSPGWLTTGPLYEALAPHAPLTRGPHAYAQFVAEGAGARLWRDALKGQIYLGDDHFVRTMQREIDAHRDPEVPRIQQRPLRETLSAYLGDKDRDRGILRAHVEGGYAQTAIARSMGLSVSRISRVISTRQAKGKT